MAQRCPESRLLGTATLQGHKWQINQRGYANIVYCPEDTIEGVVYEITENDERNLDTHEGVRHKSYEKTEMEATLHRHPLYERQLSRVLAQSRDLVTNKPAIRNAYESSIEEMLPFTVRVLVYISHNYLEDGDIRPDYATRMNDAARDAVMLGVSQVWIINNMGSFLWHNLPLLDGAAVSDDTVDEKAKPDIGERTLALVSDPALKDFIVVDNVENPGIELPAGLLQRLQDNKCPCASPEKPKVYLIEIKKGINDTQPTTVDATTDPRLANDLAVKHFKEAVDAEVRGTMSQNQPRSEEWKSSLKDGILVLLELRIKHDSLHLNTVCRIKTYPLSQRA